MDKAVNIEHSSDPNFLRQQVEALVGTVKNLVQTQQNNLQEIQRAFTLVDVHQQILSRVARDLAIAVSQKVTHVDLGLLGPLKINAGLQLDMDAYYKEFNEVAMAAGIEAEDAAVHLWAQGISPADAVAHAKLALERQVVQTQEVPESDYVIEHFGGSSGQDHQQQESTSTSTGG